MCYLHKRTRNLDTSRVFGVLVLNPARTPSLLCSTSSPSLMDISLSLPRHLFINTRALHLRDTAMVTHIVVA